MVTDNIEKKASDWNSLDRVNLFVIDFSAVVNIVDEETLKVLTDFILSKNIKVAVSRDFYESYDVIIKSQNEEQKFISKKAYGFLSSLKKSNCLMYLSNVVDSKEIVEKLSNNPKVCFIYYKCSEFAENLLSVKGICCSAIVVGEDGALHVCADEKTIIEQSLTEINLSVIDDDYFNVDFDAFEGAGIKTRDGEELCLGKRLGSGGEGAVYECSGNPGYAVKVYHKGQLNKLRLKKMFLMEKKQVKYNGLCWPEKTVFSNDGKPIGYLMKKISGKPLSKIFDGDEAVLENFPMWKKQNLVLLAIKILQKIQYLHLQGIIVGDLRMENIVIDENGEPCLVDIDSCQIGGLPSPRGFHDFTPPELQRVEFKRNLRTYKAESFSCAVMIFKLLYCGIHPYDQRNGADSIEEEIALKSFPYPASNSGDFSRIPWGGYDEMWRHTPYQMQALFYDVFKNGNRSNLQEMILMLKTYGEFLELNKATKPSLNEISFGV